MTEQHEPKHLLRTEADVDTPVEQQREELAETVEALAAKVDVPARVSAAAQDTTAKVQEVAQETAAKVQAVAQDGATTVKQNPQTAGVSLAGAVLAVVLVALVRRRRARKAVAQQSVIDILAGR